MFLSLQQLSQGPGDSIKGQGEPETGYMVRKGHALSQTVLGGCILAPPLVLCVTWGELLLLCV